MTFVAQFDVQGADVGEQDGRGEGPGLVKQVLLLICNYMIINVEQQSVWW